MESKAIYNPNETIILNKETELKAKGFFQVSESNKLKPFEYIKGVSASSEKTFGGEKNFYIKWHV